LSSSLLNLNLAVFNLLPIPPLDGGKIVMTVLRTLYRPLRKLEMPLTVGGWVRLGALSSMPRFWTSREWFRERWDKAHSCRQLFSMLEPE